MPVHFSFQVVTDAKWLERMINMDISILLALQDFRNGIGAILADFLTKMTYYCEMNTVLVIMAVIYWCVNKDFGIF